MSNEEQPLSSPSAKKAKLSGSVDDTQTSKSSLSNSVPIVPEAEKEENLFYFLGCNDGKENELQVLRRQKEYFIKKYNELKGHLKTCKIENATLKREALINNAQLIALSSSWKSLNDFLIHATQKLSSSSSSSSSSKESHTNVAMELLGLSKESEVGRVMAEFDEKEDADEICDAGNTSTKEEVYAGENAHIKSKTEKDMKRFTDTFKSEIDKQTQTTQVLMATLLTEIEHRTSPQQQSQQQSTDPTDSTSLLKGKLAELEAALYKSLREQMRAKKEVKRLKRVFQALNSEKARLVTARERLEAEVSSLRAPSQVTLTISDSTLSSAGSLSQGSLTALSSTPEPDMRRTGKDAQLTAISTSPALTYSGDQASDTPVPMPSSSSSSSLSSITSLVTSSGIAQQQLRALKDIHEADERKIRELSEQCEKYSHDVIRLELRAKNPDEETVRKHPHTVCLNDRLASLSEVNQSLSELNKSCSVQCGMVARQVRDLGQEKLRLTQALRAAQLSLAAAEKRAAKAEDDARKQRELDAAGTVAAAAAAAPDPALKNESEFLAKKTAEIEDTLVRINKDLAAKTEAFNERLCALVEKGTSIKEVESELKKTIGDLKEQVSQLLEEVVNVGSGFEALQAQNSSLTKQLSERDNARINVLREKNKLQTALDHAKKDFEAHKAELATLNDEVKSLREQIALKDNDFQDLQMKYTITQNELNDERLKSRAVATDAKLQEDKAKSAEKETSGYREKMRTYEKEIEELSVKVDTKEKAWKRAESELAKLRKTPAAGAQGNSAHTEKKLKAMQTTINAYKAKVICSLCHENDKNTVIKKCGHAFCSKCIDDAIKTRQRRCPSCHTQFGLGDISKLFLQ